MSVGFCEFDVEKKRERLRKLSDKELAREVVSSAIPIAAPNQTHGGRAHNEDTWGDADVAVRFPTPAR
jgi:hypothetical protein